MNAVLGLLFFSSVAAAVEIPLDFQAKTGPDAPRNPFIEAVINGKRASLLVDTGGGGVWLDRGFLRGLEIADARSFLPPIKIGLGDRIETVKVARAFEMPPELLEAGIVGIVNPARLLRSGFAAVDLRGLRLILEDGEPADWLRAHYPKIELEELPLRPGFMPPYDDPDAPYHAVVTGALKGFPEGPMLIDSGAGGVRLRDNYVARKQGESMKGPLTLRLGGHEIVVDAAEVGPHRPVKDVVASLGLRAIRSLVIAQPAAGGRLILGWRPFAIDPALVDSLVDAPEGLMTEHPYVAHFRKGELNLYYVSANHESGKDSETCSLIRRAFERFPIKRVIVEGRSNKDGDVESDPTDYQWGETDCAIHEGWRKGVRSIGGEPSQKAQLAAARAAGFDSRDFLADGFIKMIPAYRSQGRLERDALSALFAETSQWDRNEAGITAKFGWKDFLEWHRRKLGGEFDVAAVSHMTAAPDPRGTYLQRLAEAISILRNRFLAETISRELALNKEVLVVYGNGHHAAQRRALEAAMGAPVYEGDLRRAP